MVQNLQAENTAQSIDSLLQALQRWDRLGRQKEIVGFLEEFDVDKSNATLFDALLKGTDDASRKELVKDLSSIGSEKAIKLLKRMMMRDSCVQLEAVEALGQIGTDKAGEALLSALMGRYVMRAVRLKAARALRNFDSDRVADALIQAANHPLVGSGLDLANADKAVGVEAVEVVMKGDLFEILRESKPEYLIAPLCQRVQDRSLSSDDRIEVADMLGIIGTENEIPLLRSIARRDDDGQVGWHALRAAEQIALSEIDKKAERERTLEETRGFFAHEFRHCLTPLNAYVKMLGEALTQPQDDKEKLLSLTARIRQQTDAAIELVERYLDYSRPLVAHFARVNISDLLGRSLIEFGADLEKRSIVLESRLAEDFDAEVDQQMVAQVLRNVLANAIQAMDQEGELTITSATGQDHVVVTVRDSGAGIKPAHLAHVFEIGFTTKSNVRGAGLGLALCKRIIEEAHHGTLAIANNSDGPGATVLITLPTKQMEIENGRHALALADR